LKSFRSPAVLLIFIIIASSAVSVSLTTPVRADGDSGGIQVKREVTIPVNVIFVGIDPATVDLSYMKWNFNVPTRTIQEILYPAPHPSGVVYNVQFSFKFAPDSYKDQLIQYLDSIGVEKEAANPWFYYYAQTAGGYITSNAYYTFKYTAYDANSVEDWIYANQKELGGFQDNAWTLMFLNLPELPSFDFQSYKAFLSDFRTSPPDGTAHYYSVSYKDQDLGYRLRFRDFMTAWGNIHRFWFADLSAGPSFWSDYEDLPLQVALEDNKIDINTSFGRTWFTEYLSDYIWQATWNFVTPDLIYAPMYSQKYVFDVQIFDGRTAQEKGQVDIKSTVNAQTIKNAFEDLTPYSQIEVNLSIEDLTKYPHLRQIISDNYKYTDSFTFGINAQPLEYGIVDARPIYKYLQDNFQKFEPNFRRDGIEYHVPVFAFAFSENTLFTFTYKWIIADAETSVKSLLGVALGDLALVSLSQNQFERGNYVSPLQPNKGYGFTETIIHEAGHMLGLAHPHEFGPIGDFSLGAMGYFTWDYVFGQSDKDAVRRAHADEIITDVQSKLDQLADSNAQSGDVQEIRNQLNDADAQYSEMNYSAALESALKAEGMAKAVMAGSTILPGGLILPQSTAAIVYVVIGLAVGLVFGVIAVWLILKRGPSKVAVRRGRRLTSGRRR